MWPLKAITERTIIAKVDLALLSASRGHFPSIAMVWTLNFCSVINKPTTIDCTRRQCAPNVQKTRE